jgi:tRNA A-37 threonylcarbamoyl transferase component Bud32
MFVDLFRKLATFTRSTGLPVVRARGWAWQLTPAGADLFGPDGPDLERWIAGRAVFVVKSNPARTVYRVELPGTTVFVKHCRITGPRAFGREVIRPPKARLEFDNALALRERGIAAVEPLAWGGPDSWWPGESVLITRGLTAAVPFQRYLEHDLPALPPEDQRAVRRQLAFGLAGFLAKLHDAGVVHPDPHPGNLLIEMPASRVPHFALIDLHAIRIGKPLSWPASRDNLVLYNQWFQLRATRAERTRFWHAYRLARATLPPPAAPEMAARARELERETQTVNRRQWAGREWRCVGSNRHFRRVAVGAIRGFGVRDLPAECLTPLLRDPDAAFTRPGARILKQSADSAVVELVLLTPDGPVPAVLKRVSASCAGALKNLLRRSQVLRSWVSGHALRDRWLPTPRPLAVFHRVRIGLPAEGYLLTEKVAAAVGLDAAVRHCPDRATLRDLIRRVARVLRTMHDRGVSHRDLKAANILITGGEPVLIDLVGVRTRVRLGDSKRARELARLNASFLRFPAVTRGERLRFLRAYLAAGPALGAGWKSWWEMISRSTASKVARNRRRGRMLG